MSKREDLRTVAIVAHVDHGKTTLVDALFRQGGLFREGQVVADRVMDSNDQERERGITILAKSTSVVYGGLTLQLVDTPGHADFGAEVERTVRMVDGILLLVDAAEGPLPQTRFVLRKALALGLPAVLAINKIDRQDARPQEVLDEVYDLFIELGADDSQLEFPVLYTNARAGTATADLTRPGEDLQPLVAALASAIPSAEDRGGEPFLMQVNSLAHDDYVGRLVVGRVVSGRVTPNDTVFVRTSSMRTSSGGGPARVTGLFTFAGVDRRPLASAKSGDVVAIAGFDDISIGDTLAGDEDQPPLPPIAVDEPTVEMVFQVNDGPLAGRSGGKFLTSRHLRERLAREAYANVSVRVEPGASPEQFRVRGRGELQLAVLIETLRREKYELCVRPPVVVTREGEGGREEPIERLVVDIPTQHLGAVNELIGSRRGKLLEQRIEGERVRLEFDIPTRGLLGLRGHLLTITRGTAIASHVFEGWVPWGGPMIRRQNGALVSDRAGKTTPYALFHLQPRGVLFVPAGTTVYEGMIIGAHNRNNDLNVNPVREKKLTNVRAAGKDEQILLTPPQLMNLEQALEWMRDDEMLEVTPEAIRLRKAVLAASTRSRSA